MDDNRTIKFLSNYTRIVYINYRKIRYYHTNYIGIAYEITSNLFLIDHICYYVQVISIGEGGKMGVSPFKVTQLYRTCMCIFIYIEILKSGLFTE